MMHLPGRNESIPMTRRYPNLKRKVLERDGKIAQQIITAWDIEHDSDKVLRIFLKEQNNLSDQRYWELMRTVWIVCGSVHHNDIFRKLMQSKRKHQYYFSTPEEAKIFNAIRDDDRVLAWRATNDPNDNGLSWTFNKAYAIQYGLMFNKEHIIKKYFSKDQIFAYINRNNEEEIIIL